MSTNTLVGLDLSHTNPTKDLHKVLTTSQSYFVILKATEGKSFVDPLFLARFQNLKKYMSQVKVGPYHFLRTDSPPKVQIQHLATVLKSTSYGTLDIIPWIDAETGLKSEEPSLEMVQEAVDECNEIFGACGVYSGRAYWQEHDFQKLTGLKGKWVADYGHKPTIPFDIWQDSESFKDPDGYKYDHDIFYGTAKDFERLLLK